MDRLQKYPGFTCKIAEHGEKIQSGHVCVAPTGERIRNLRDIFY
jgi:chemotaxis response regulator CheB